MKRILLLALFSCFITIVNAQQPFKFAFLSDTHISTDPGVPADDLRRTIADLNLQSDLDFIVITGDITEMGTAEEIKLAKSIFNDLKIPYHIVPGNHDSGWSESGGVDFIREFGYDKFVFDHKGYRFIGCASGPYVRMSDGHIPRDAVVWLDSVLAKTPKEQPLVFLNHYPLTNELDNWYEITDRLKKYNTQFVLAGHHHTSKPANFEGIPATHGRSNLRAKAETGAYNIVTVRTDSVLFAERNPLTKAIRPWRSIALGKRSYEMGNYPRPSFEINNKYPNVKPDWVYHSSANVVSTPAYANGLVIFGNSLGKIEAVSVKDGKPRWSYQTGGGIYSSAAADGNNIVMGSGDGSIYCLNSKNGKVNWILKTSASVLGAVEIENHIAYVGGSDHRFRAIDVKSGKEVWSFDGLTGSVVSKPLIYDGKVIFGSWDTHLYALDKATGSLVWKWNNGSAVRHFSPAMCNPLAYDGVVYIVAPDKFLSAIDAATGKTLWRSNAATIRESIGISADNKLIYGKTMNDEIVAFRTDRTKGELAWRLNAGFGYEHVPSMLIENNGQVYFGTKSGVTYSIDPALQKINWAYKLDNSMINTVNVIGKNKVVVASMDGKVSVLRSK
ncbi:MAG: PQQ-binding-like beta-propeller repeat protein [Bacteroidota bacterium]